MPLFPKKIKFHWLIYFDAIWCNHFQLPATYFFLLSENSKKTRELEINRFFSFLGFIIELLGVFFLTYGLANFHSTIYCMIGILMKVFGSLLGSFTQNKSGVLWTLELQEKINALKTHDNEVKAILINHGITEQEVNALSTIGSDIYQTELNSYQRMRLQNFCFPIACGIGLFFCNEIIFGLFVIFLGLLSFPLGEMFYRKHVFRSESEIRAGRSAALVSYLEKTYVKQQITNFWVNFLSQIPLLLFVLRFMFGSIGTLLSVFYATTQGLLGLTGTLAFQRTRATSERSVKIAKHLIDALNSLLFIIAPCRWKEHTQIKTALKGDLLFSNGIVFQNFQTNDLQKLPPLNLSIEAGGGVVVKASSGQGKSQLILAIVHLIEHQGDIFIIKNNHISNVHEYSQTEFKNIFFFCKEDNIEKGVRIVDLFRNSFERSFVHLKEKHTQNIDNEFVDLAWKMSDNLLESEIFHLRNGVRSSFPKNTRLILEELRKERSIWVQKILKLAEGNLAKDNITPERIFATLSSGEKKRLLVTLAETESYFSEIDLIIFDEPFAHLDTESIELQLKAIQRLKKTVKFIISHHHEEKIFHNFKNFHRWTIS